MKKISSFILCAFMSTCSIAATNVSGIISKNTTWTKANAPYFVTGDILIDSNGSLNIEPGVEVSVSGDYVIYIEGKFSSTGTENEPVNIHVTNPSLSPYDYNWKGFQFRWASRVHKVNIEYTNFSDKGTVLKFNYNDITVKHCKFNNKAAINYSNIGYTLDKSFNAISITYCDFNESGIYTSPVSGYGQRVSTDTIAYNHFYKGSLIMRGCASAQVTDNIFENGGGMEVDGFSVLGCGGV